MVRFLHLADLHLDTPFNGLKRTNPSLQKKLIQATNDALRRAVSIALNQHVDFVVIVGDLYDATHHTIAARHFLYQQLQRLEQAKIPVILCHGNHDYLSTNQTSPRYPQNVHLFDQEQVTTYSLDTSSGEKVNFYGFSYHSQWIEENLVKTYPSAKDPGAINIGLLHGQVQNSDQSNPYAPFKLSDLLEKNYDYWALGHIHQQEILSREPYIVYSGTIIGKHPNETGDKGGYLVEIKKDKPSRIDFVSLAPVRWEKASLECQNTWDEIELMNQMQRILQNYQDESMGTKQQYLVTVSLSHIQRLTRDLQDKLMDGHVFAYLQESQDLDGNAYLVSLKTEMSQTSQFFSYDQELEKSYLQISQQLSDPAFIHRLLQTQDFSGKMKQFLREIIDEDLERDQVIGIAKLQITNRLGMESQEVFDENK